MKLAYTDDDWERAEYDYRCKKEERRVMDNSVEIYEAFAGDQLEEDERRIKGCIVSNIERAAFEQAVADKWSDSYKFTRFGDEDYFDEIVEGMWRGWQASRQALEGEPFTWLIQMKNDYLITRGIWEKPDSRGYTNDINEAGRYTEAAAKKAEQMMPHKCKAVRLYTHPAIADNWIKCIERLPDLGQRVILKSRGVVQNYMPVFDQGDDDHGMGDYFWDFEDVMEIDNPLVDFEKDCWMPLPEQEQGQ